MKYAQQIQDYINGNENIGEPHEKDEDAAVHVSDPIANSGISDEVEPAPAPAPEPAPAPKKKRGRPVGSKTKKRGRPVGSKTKNRKYQSKNKTIREKLQHTATLTPELNKLLCDDCENEFRAFSHQVQYIITQYYRNNGKL